MRHRRQELALRAIGGLGLPHRLFGEHGGPLGLLLGRDQGALGIAPLEQRAELAAVIVQKRSVLTPWGVAHHATSSPSEVKKG